MRLIKIIATLVLILTISSCSESQKYNAEDVLKEAPHQLELNEGEKWVVDKEMMVSIKSMEKSILDFKGNEISGFHNLSKTIKSNLSELTSSCTMKGQSHDELHKWLLPFFDLNFVLMETENSDEANQALESMEYELFVFGVYFK